MLCIFSTSKVWALVAMVVVGMAVVAFVGCQWHTASHDQMQASPAGNQRAPSPQTTLDLLCLVAAFPLVGLFWPLSLSSCRMPWSWCGIPTEFAHPPFIPPEDLRCARSSSQ